MESAERLRVEHQLQDDLPRMTDDAPGPATCIGLLTLESLPYDLADKVHAARAAVLKAAYAAHPERFVRTIPVPPIVPEAAWINKPKPASVSEEVRH